ncbi:hypothetical protein CAPTEDRAFT_120580, partial [Capitella teleta]
DTNECDTDNGGCEQTCTDSEGSFTCGCRTGFSRSVDASSCDGQLNITDFPPS